MSEKLYDEEIAPALLKIGKRCEELGLSMVSVVEYAPNERGSTCTLTAAAGLEMRMQHMLTMAGQNVDGFLLSLIRYCRTKGIDMGTSIFLKPYAEPKEPQA